MNPEIQTIRLRLWGPWLLTICLLTGAVPCWALSHEDARHLLARTGFEPREAEIQALLPLSRQQAVRRLVNEAQVPLVVEPPQWMDDPLPNRRQMRSASDAEKKQYRKQNRKRRVELKAWYYRQLLASSSPLAERMTLFWHNHFTSSLKKVKSPQLIYRQHLLLREHALGSFKTLLYEVAADPAMVLYLDSASNRKGKPNENFARELLELFTLGEGEYSETDIKEAARAFTGWSINRKSGEFRFRTRQHDKGSKRFLGHRGAFKGDDILKILLLKPQTAERITAKLWNEFITVQVKPGWLRDQAANYRRSGYDNRMILRRILLSDAFWSQANRGSRIKSPVELIVGALRVFEIDPPQGRALVFAGRQLGQDLFDPPNVKGWPGGNAWIDSNTLLLRKQLINRFMQGQEMNARKRRKASMSATAGMKQWLSGLADTAQTRESLRHLLLPIAPVNPADEELPLREYVGQLLLDPAYQLN